MEDLRPLQLLLHGGDDACEQLVAGGVVAGGLGPGDAVGGIVGGDDTEVVSLHSAVGGAGFAARLGRDFGQQLAGGIARADIDQELVFGGAVADAGERFAVLRHGFAAPGIAHLGLRHEIALVGAVGEHAALEDSAVFGCDGGDARAFAAHAVLFAKAVVDEHRDTGVAQHLAHDVLADLRLVKPGDRVEEAVDLVAQSDAVVELEGQAADHLALTDIGAREAACGHAAHVRAGLEQHGFQAVAGAFDGGHHAARRTAVNHQVVALRGGGAGGEKS